MSDTPDIVDTSAINKALVGTRFGSRLQHFASVTSTNTLLLEAAAAGADEGTAIVADEQTAGRGRSGNAWHSPTGFGLYLSTIVKPALPLANALHLSLATGLAAHRAIRELTDVATDLHWPNDLYIGAKKLGGILVETASESGPDPMLRYAVIGIGINVHHREFPAELAPHATSLAIASGRNVSRGALVIALLRALDIELMQLEDISRTTSENLLERFTDTSTWVRGRRVRVPEQGGYTGITAGLDSRGFLLVHSDDGITRTVLSGGVRAEA